MTARSCQTCKHYEPSAVWRRGWCRNPRLYSPQQSHMVEQDSLDCSRGLGCAWEAADDTPVRTPAPDEKPVRQPLRLFAPQPRLAMAGAGAAGGMMESSDVGAGGGSSGGGGGQFAGPPRSDRTAPPTGQERTVSYQPEERYWTDYLRIALPLIGLVVLLGVFWYWGNSLIGGGSDEEPTPTPVVAVVDEINASPPPATPTPPQVALQPTPGAAETPAAGGQPPATDPEPTPGNAADPEESEQDPPEAAPEVSTTIPELASGTTAVTDGPVNLRAAASAESDLVAELEDGTSVTVTGVQVADEEGDNREWYPVETSSGETGYIREDLLIAET